MKVAFLFDNDGVLIDSSEFHWQSWLLLMQEEPEITMTHEQFIPHLLTLIYKKYSKPIPSGKKGRGICASIGPRGLDLF